MKKTLGITALAICLVLTACAAGPTDNSEILNKIDSLQSSVDTLQTTLEEMQEPSSGSSTTEQASSSSTTEPSQPEEASGTPADYQQMLNRLSQQFEEMTVSEDRLEKTETFFSLKSQLDDLEKEASLYKSSIERQFLEGNLDDSSYRTQVSQINDILEEIYAARSTLETKFGLNG